MIDLVTLSKAWITEKQQKYRRDPSIIESMVHALYLLEQLRRTGLDFIFKGGTSLILLLEKPARFSVDIDIVVSPGLTKEELEAVLSALVNATGIFLRVELDERRSYKPGVPKAHYRFIYKSIMDANAEREILLDVLFAENPYPVVIEKPIVTEWIKSEGDAITVRMPCHNSIAGDKLTAFAPNTTGIPYYRESMNKGGSVYKSAMFMEIVKQLFDVACLFDVMDDLEMFRRAYDTTVEAELSYRKDSGIISRTEVLNDTITTAYILARKERYEDPTYKECFANLSIGISQFGHVVYQGGFRIEHAQLAASKAVYLAAILLKEYRGPLLRFDEEASKEKHLITHPTYNYLNKQLKFIAKGAALFYWNHALELLHA